MINDIFQRQLTIARKFWEKSETDMVRQLLNLIDRWALKFVIPSRHIWKKFWNFFPTEEETPPPQTHPLDRETGENEGDVLIDAS